MFCLELLLKEGEPAMARGFSLFVVFIVFILAAGCGQDQTPSSQKQTAAPAATAAPPAASTQPAAPAASVPAAAPTTAVPAPSLPAPAVSASGPQNFAQVQMGMTSQQVLQLIGSPGRTKQEGAMVEWEYYTPQGKFELHFQNDRVARISNH